jgi:hypothetical protein
MTSERKYISINTMNLKNRIFYCLENIISELLFEICSDRKDDYSAARRIIEIRNKINIRGLIESLR